MTRHEYVLQGVVVGGPGRVPLAGCRIEAWDLELVYGQQLGTSTVDKRGRFEITCDGKRFVEAFFDRRADVFFRVFDQQRLVLDTRSKLWCNLTDPPADLTIEVPMAPADIPAAPKLTSELLLALRDHADATPDELAAQVPELQRQLVAVALVELRRRLDHLLADASSALRDHVAKWDLRPLANPALGTGEWLRGQLQGKDVPLAVRRERLVVAGRSDLPTLAEILRPATSVRDNPVFAALLGSAELSRLAGLLKLPGSVVDRLRSLGVAPNNLDDSKLDTLVMAGILDEETARRLGVHANVWHWAGGDLSVVEACVARVASLKHAPLAHLRDLALLTRADLVEILAQAGGVQPSTNHETRAATLARTVELLFPDAVLGARLARIHDKQLVQDLEATTRLLARNPVIFGRGAPAELDLSEIAEQDLADMRAAVDRLRKLAARHPGLGKVLDDAQASPQDKAKRTLRRTGLVAELAQHNGPRALTSLDTYDPEAVKQLASTTLSAEEREAALDDVRQAQRLLRITGGDTEAALSLAEQGIEGAFAIVRQSTVTISEEFRERAQRSAADLLGGMGTLFDWYGHSPGPTTRTTEDPLLHEIPGFSHYFGNREYCRCEHCRSILSPAAYFVDLMQFIEQRISIPTFGSATPATSEPLSLFQRRRDLWTGVPLTCEATETLVPYLTIINEILENYIAGVAAPTPSLERAPIEELVYRRLYERGSVERPTLDSFAQPFLLPLERVRVYLGEHTRADVVSAVLAGQPEFPLRLTRARLDVSDREYALIAKATENADQPAFLREVYRLDVPDEAGELPDVPASGAVAAFDPHRLLSPMQVTRAQLGALVATAFVDPTDAIAVRAQTVGDDIQPTREVIEGLTRDALDRLHRFTRLWKRTPWTIEELDLVVAHLGGADGGLPVIGVASLVALGKRFGLAADELCGLCGVMPTALFDRLFNAASLLRDDADEWDAATFSVEIAVPGTGASDAAADRILAALRLDLRALQALLGAAATVTVDLGVLTRWYQHARLAAAYRVSVPELLELLALLGVDPAVRLDDVAQLEARIAMLDRWVALEIDVDDLAAITSTASADGESEAAGASLLAAVVDGGALAIADTTFAFFEGVTETASREILALNATGYTVAPGAGPVSVSIPAAVLADLGVADPSEVARALGDWLTARRASGLPFHDGELAGVGGISRADVASLAEANPTVFVALPRLVRATGPDRTSYKLTSAFAPDATPALPPGVPLTSAAAAAHLAQFQPSELLPAALATTTGTSAARVRQLLRLAGFDLSTSALRGELVTAFDATAPTARLVEIVAKVRRLASLFADSVFVADVLARLADAAEAGRPVLAIADYGALALDDVELVTRYRDLLVEGASDRDAIDTALDELRAESAPPRLSEAVAGRVATILDAAPAVVSALVARLQLSPDPVTALEKLVRCAKLARDLRVPGDALVLLASSAYEDLDRAADALVAGLHDPDADDATRRQTIDPLEDAIRERRRDALVDYIAHTQAPGQFRRADDLYHWFLIDTQLQGCARTSRVVAANASLQLYVQRCLMRLEQNADGTRIVTPDPDTAAQWTWRKNYRVWEANRRVFLYPESYVLEALRDDKTELFEKHEANLLAGRVDDQSVLDTYGAYLGDFGELAELKIAGSYHDHAKDRDVLHVFASNRGNPPDHWYRTIENVYRVERGDVRHVTWGPWRKVNVQIPVREVSPVVYQGRLYVFWVEVNTRPDNDTATGRSRFVGYKHAFKICYTALRLDGTWTAPQPLDVGADRVLADPLASESDRLAAYNALRSDVAELGSVQEALITELIDGLRNQLKDAPSLADSETVTVPVTGIVSAIPVDPRLVEIRRLFIPEYDLVLSPPPVWQLHVEPHEHYTLSGWRWGRVYPSPASSRIVVSWRDGVVRSRADLFARSLASITPSGTQPSSERRLYSVPFDTDTIYCGFTRSIDVDAPYAQAERICHTEATGPRVLSSSREIVTYAGKTAIQTINGSLGDAILDVEGDVFYLYAPPESGPDAYVLERLGTTLATRMRALLFEHGVDRLLASDTQESSLGEAPTPLHFEGDAIFNDAQRSIDQGIPDFTGPLGVYFREIFLHLPWRIAEHLSSQGEYELAHRWLRYILDPTASEIWQFVEFRRHHLASLREQLQDQEAIDVSARDPFNPHAIARLRLGAYMRGVWMKMVTNLLDWGDHLFSRDTAEDIGEATLLYVMASDLLGPRPEEIGDCREEGDPSERTYERLRAELGACPTDAVAALETVSGSRPREGAGTWWLGGTVPFYLLEGASDDARRELEIGDGRSPGIDWGAHDDMAPVLADFATSLLGQACEFCVPPNPELLALWDRVEDRLYKIRNCMNLEGVRRQLALLSPPIDPALLVSARAAGLALDDVLDATGGNLPPYRFSFLIAKLKEYAAALQGFGGALLAAIERKDGEELARLRMVHEQNILALSTRLRDQDVEAAEQALESLIRHRDTVTRRRDHQQMLIDQGLSGWETAQRETKRTATITLSIPPALELISASLELIPKIVGTASSTGGDESARSTHGFGAAAKAAAEQALRVADELGLEASFERRLQGWRLQLELADLELREIESQIATQQVRVDMARRAREVHERTQAQLDETIELFASKFSNLALYEWLATTLQRLYRQAYENARQLLRLAENAYRFERGDRAASLATTSYWDGGRAGLLAGEKLMADVRELERRFMETNYRAMEIDQSFSLAQISPRALWELKQTGECEVTIPELYFDLYYPGQYRRRIRSARLTIPAITGPHTNISATLQLVGSKLRTSPQAELVQVPPTRSVAIATSTAQHDAGMFNVDFRDERYMPFEGAGAVESTWRLTLPKSFRPFDYATINDVILHLSYTAEYDAAFGRQVEASNGSLMRVVTTAGALPRALSLRQEFSSAFHRLVHSSTGEAATFELSARHFPLFLQGSVLRVSRAYLLVDHDPLAFLDDDGSPPATIAFPAFVVTCGGTATGELVPDENLGGLRAVGFDLPVTQLDLRREPIRMSLAVTRAGDFGPRSPAPSDPSALDDDKLRDVILYLEYAVA